MFPGHGMGVDFYRDKVANSNEKFGTKSTVRMCEDNVSDSYSS